MLTWIDDSNKYERVQKAYFGSYEITIIDFMNGDFCAWVKELGGPIVQPNLFKRSYHQTYNTIEEVKEVFLKAFKEYLDERVVYWMTIQHDYWKEVQWLDEEDE